MARLHLKFKKDSFDPRLRELTDRFFLERRRARIKKTHAQSILFDTWLHGACMVHELPLPSLIMDPKAPTPSGFMTNVGYYDAENMTIVLRKWSAISLFHQFRHHMQRFATETWDHETDGRDAQQWACSLFYQTDKRRFRRWVRRGRVAGVTEQDLLKRLQA
jgi:hypothetical protein